MGVSSAMQEPRRAALCRSSPSGAGCSESRRDQGSERSPSSQSRISGSAVHTAIPHISWSSELDSNLYLRRHRDDLTLTVEHRAAPSPDPIPLTLTSDGDALALAVTERSDPGIPSSLSLDDRITGALADAAAPDGPLHPSISSWRSTRSGITRTAAATSVQDWARYFAGYTAPRWPTLSTRTRAAASSIRQIILQSPALYLQNSPSRGLLSGSPIRRGSAPTAILSFRNLMMRRAIGGSHRRRSLLAPSDTSTVQTKFPLHVA